MRGGTPQAFAGEATPVREGYVTAAPYTPVVRTWQLYLGLWARMAVALVLGAVGAVFLLAVEFVFAAGMILVWLVMGGLGLGLGLLGSAVVLALLVGVIWLVTLRRGHRTLSDLREGAEAGPVDTPPGVPSEPPTVEQATRLIGGVAGVGVGVLVVYGVVSAFAPDPIVVSAGGGAAVVVGFTGWVIASELGSTSVQSGLAAEHDVVSAPELQASVERRIRRLAAQTDSPVPDIEITGSSLPRAATVGYRPESSVVFVSRGLVERLDDDELDAVLAHELAHLINRDAAVLTALSMPRAKLRQLASVPGGASGGLSFVLVLAAPVYVLNRLAVPMVARYREYVADEVAGELTGDPAAMAGALATLDRESSVGHSPDLRLHWSTAAFGVVPPPWEERKVLDGPIRFVYRRLLGTHPPTGTRIERLRSRLR